MGNTTSDLQEAAEEVEQQVASAAPPAPDATKLFKYFKGSTAGAWRLASAAALPRFYDAKEDRGKAHEWWLEIESGDIDVRVDEELQYVADASQQRITFAACGELWALKFATPQGYREFRTQLGDYVFYNTYGFDKDSDKGQKELGNFAGIMWEANAAEAAPAPMEVDDRADEPAPGEFKVQQKEEDMEGTPIAGLIMGGMDRSYLVHGDSTFDVLRNVEGGVESAGVTPFSFTPAKGRAGASTPTFTPTKVVLGGSERFMNMLAKEDATKLYHGDVEYQKIITEFNFDKDSVNIPQIDITNDSKQAQLQDANALLGLDANRICRWDMRTPGGVATYNSPLPYTGGKDFARGTNFTCMATSGEGWVVVGSKDGKLRLYNGDNFSQAKTSIPGLGKPITAVDVTYDGRYVLATTDDYLLLVKTTWMEGAKELCGFTARGGGGEGKLPKLHLLRLTPEDRSLTGSKPFKKARFTWVTEQGRQERWMVATCGQYSVLWNFRKVRATTTTSTAFGGLPVHMSYTLTRKDTEVVDSTFMPDRFTPMRGGRYQDALVVATPHKLYAMTGADEDDE